MVAAVILTISTVAFVQFWLFYWRAMIAGVAQQPVSDRVLTAVGITSGGIAAGDFRTLLSLYKLAPGLSGPGAGFGGLRMYYGAVESLKKMIPPVGKWADAEMATCSRYVAVMMGQHLESNVARATEMRGF